MVFSGCLKGNEVYRLIEWRVVVLLGGMLALGLAMEESGTAELIAREVGGRAAEAGPRVLIATLFLPLRARGPVRAHLGGGRARGPDRAQHRDRTRPLRPGAVHGRGRGVVVRVPESLRPPREPSRDGRRRVQGHGLHARGAPLFLLLLLLVVFFLPVVWPI